MKSQSIKKIRTITDLSSNNLIQEHLGLAKVHTLCAEMDAIWRTTACSDLGIDGQIEFLEAGTSVSTGSIVAVQVKSGPSYFNNEIDGIVKYYVSKKHRKYWNRLNLPVILILHHPEKDLTIYTRVKPQLQNKGPILVSTYDRFVPDARCNLLACAKEDATQMSPSQVLTSFKKAKLTISQNRTISGIEFILACTHPSKNYFELRMCRIMALLELVAEDIGVSIGQEVYDFILQCVMKTWAANLTEPFEQEFEEIWYDLKLVPDVIITLTPIGHNVLKYLWGHLDEYFSASSFKHLGHANVALIASEIVDLAQHYSNQFKPDNFRSNLKYSNKSITF